MQFITSGNRIATENFSIGKVYTVTFTNGNYFINSCVGIGLDFVMFQQESPKMLFCLDMESAETVSSIEESGGGSGTTNYNELDNKPSINGVTLVGNKTAADLSILPVPIVGENDNNKILTASYSGGVGSYSWQPAPSSGTTDYTQLTNKPQINSVELNGNKSLADLGIASAEALAGKQDVISDLSTIRSGAAAGATAVQPATLAGYQTLIDSSHKLSSDLVDDTGHTNKFATAAQLAQIETNKTNISLIKHAANTSIYIQETQPTGAVGDYWLSSTNGVKVYGRTANLFNTFDVIGRVPSVNNGEIVDRAGSASCTPFAIDSGDITITKPAEKQIYVCLYQSDMTYIGYLAMTDGSAVTAYGKSITGYENARYCIVRIESTADLDTYQLMVNAGDTAIPYIPYMAWH